MTKAGIITLKGNASTDVPGSFASSTNSSTSLGRVCRNIKDRSGLAAASTA